MANFISDFFENRGWLGLVQQNPTTGALEVGGVAVTGATEYTLTQFLQLDVADYPNYTILISDVPTPHSTVNGVLVRANSAGTAWIWTETMSLTVAQIASYAITAAIASGWRIFVSDIGVRGSYWYSNGTRFNLDQDSVVLDNMLTDYNIGTSTTNKVGRQCLLPLLDGKNIWGDGDILEITTHWDKTGTNDAAAQTIFIGATALSPGATETNTLGVTSSFTAGSASNPMQRRYLRKSSTSFRAMTALTELALGGSVGVGGYLVDYAPSSLDGSAFYVSTAVRFTASTTDTNITLKTHTVALISSGAV